MIKTRTIMTVLVMSVCLVLLWWGSAKNVHASSSPAASTGRLSQGHSGTPDPTQPHSPSSPRGQSQHRPVSEATGEERPRAQKPRRFLSGDSGRRRFKGRGRRKSTRGRGGSARPGGNAVSEARLMKFLKRHMEMSPQTPRKQRIAKKWANESSHGIKMNTLLTRKLGAAPILQHFIERMGVVPHIDRLVPAHKARRISHGEAVAALMVYLLDGGRALYRMEQWAEQTSVLSWLCPQYEAKDWTDDRLADTLDALYDAGLESVQGELSAHIVSEFGLKLREIHYDTTSVSLWGTYDSESGQPAVLITFGDSKDHRPDLKQVVVGSAVSGDGGVPLLSNTHDGNTSDSTVPIPYWERLRKLAGTSEFCFIGDCKLASQKNLKAICTADGIFLSPLAISTTEQTSIRKQIKSGELTFTPLEMPEDARVKPVYEKRTERVGNRRKRPQESVEDAGGDTGKQEEGKGKERKQDASYSVFEETTELRDTRNRPHTIRRLIVRSSQLRRKHANTRARHLREAEEDIQAVRGTLNTRNLKTRTAVETAVKKILQKHKVSSLVEVSVEETREMIRKQLGRGRPCSTTKYVEEELIRYDVTLSRLQDTIDEKAMLDGIFMLATNHEASAWPASRVLALYKRQYKVEQVFRVLKGPLAVSPMLLERPGRICAMMCRMTLTLQRYTLVRRRAMQALESRESPLSGLMPNNIQTWRPQTDELIAAFENIQVVEYHHEGMTLSDVTSLNETQIDMLTILGVAVEKYRFTSRKLNET